MIINRKYKDRLFRMVFHEKESLLELYNAINGTFYEDANDLEITTIQDAIYMSMKNDVSFLIRDVLNLYEHQSTVNPNMAVRGFLYLADLYRKYIKENELNLYGRRQITLPTPIYLVFYNGVEEEPDRMETFLSDCFERVEHIVPCLECKAVLLNINLGHNRELMERCKRLDDYAKLVYQVRVFKDRGMELEDAVEAAVAYCISHGIMENWLVGHRAEVMNVLLTEYDEEKHIQMERAESKAEGRAEGRTEGRISSVLELLSELGEVSSELKAYISSQTDIQVLSQWLKIASKVETIEEFWKKIEKPHE